MRFCPFPELRRIDRIVGRLSLIIAAVSVMALFLPCLSRANGFDDLIEPNKNFVLSEQETQFICSLAPLRVMIDDNFVPLSSYDAKTRTFHGISVDLFRHAAEKLGLKYQLLHDKSLSWSDKVELFKKGKLDLLMPVSFTEERAQYGIFGNSFYDTYYGAIGKKTGNIRISKIHDLALYKIGMTKASAIIPFIQSTVPGAQIIFYENQKDLYQGVRNGDIDVALQNKNVFNDDRFNLGFVDLIMLYSIVEYPRRYAYFWNRTESYHQLAAIMDRYLVGADYSRLVSNYERREDELILLYNEQKHQKKLLLFGIAGSLTLLALLAATYFNHKRSTAKLAESLVQIQNQQVRLQKSEAEQRAMIENIVDVIVIIDQAGIIKYISPNIEKWFGWHPEDIVGEHTRKNIHPADLHNSQRVFDFLKSEANAVITEECRYLCKDGSYKWIEYTAANLLHDPEIEGFLLSYHDISDRKHAEVTLRQEKSFSDRLLNSQNDTVFLFEAATGKPVRWNKRFTEVCGYNDEEIAVMKAPDDFHGENDLKRAEEYFDKIVADGRGVVELSLVTKLGGCIPFEYVATVIESEVGKTLLLTIGRDISERRRAEEERLLLERQFHHAQKLESLGVLTGGIAHDFNNILTVILGYCHLVKETEDINSSHEYITSFEHVESAANRAADLCRQMLIYAGRSEFVQTRLNLRLLVDEVVKMLRSAIGKHVDIELDLNSNVPQIIGDSGQIQQIVMNLIINAAEAIGDVHGNIRVALTVMKVEAEPFEIDTFGTVILAGKYACLEVSDTGCGMDDETRKRIFEPFFTTKFTGRGLGMSAIHGIIKSHGGVLQLTSSPGAGSTFKVCFPLPDAPDDFAIAQVSAAIPEKMGGRVLLVDDESALRDMGARLLGMMGFTTMTAQHGREALEVYWGKDSEVDVVLLDLIMPVMGGIEAYHEFRKIAPTLPIIICSGYNVESVSEIISNDERAGFVHKPYKPQQLRDMMLKVME